MRIEPIHLDTAGDAVLQAWADLFRETGTAWQPEGIRPTPEVILNELRHQSANKVWSGWLAYDGGAVVAGAEMEWRDTPDNRDRAFLHFEVRDPAALDALAATAAEVALAAGRPVVNADVPAGSAPDDWISGHGAKLGSVEQHNVTRFAALDRDDVASLATTAPDGYELVWFEGPVPDDVMDPYVTLVRTMNDAPLDELTMEDWVFTPETVRAWEGAIAARGHRLWTAVAREKATGELAGLNQLVVKPDWTEVIENEDTCVARAHRGHGLGLFIKAANLLRAMDETDARCISTWNAASNSHMLRVNRRLGFVCEHTWHSYEIGAAKLL